MGNTTKQYSISLPPQVVEQVDTFVGKDCMYTSRNEFVREAIRMYIREMKREGFRQIRKQIGDRLKRKGIVPELIETDEQKEKVLARFFKEKGLV